MNYDNPKQLVPSRGPECFPDHTQPPLGMHHSENGQEENQVLTQVKRTLVRIFHDF